MRLKLESASFLANREASWPTIARSFPVCELDIAPMMSNFMQLSKILNISVTIFSHKEFLLYDIDHEALKHLGSQDNVSSYHASWIA